MEQQRLAKIVEEVRQQCRFGKIAWQSLRAGLNGMDLEKTFFYIHALLDRAHQTAQFLWPAGTDDAKDGDALRKTLKIPEDSALKTSGLAAFAESGASQFRLWLDGLDHFHFIGMNIMPRGSTSEYRQDVFLRSLDPEVFQFSWRDRVIDLRKIAASLRAIESSADFWLKRRSA